MRHAAIVAFVLAGCAKDVEHPPFASGTCTESPCGVAIYHGRPGRAVPDAAVDAGSDSRDGGP
jgi:hypothetical protein